MAWDPKTYLSFEGERTRPAAELLARVAAENPKRAIDLGCGPGNSTALLARRWPDADLEGLDSSPDMLAEAQKSGVAARWREGDIAEWSPASAYDVIFSNATLQWITDHERLLPRLMSFVGDGGTFAFQVPTNLDAPGHALMRKVAGEGPWAAKMAGTVQRDWHTVRTPAAYFEILEPHARRIDIWETTYLQALEGEDAVYRWLSGTGLRPYAEALDGADREAFLAEYKRQVAAAYPRRASGKTLYPFRRLFAVATR